MNFEYTDQEKKLISAMDEALKGTPKPVETPELLKILAPLGYTTLHANGHSGALASVREALTLWQPDLSRTLETSLRMAAPLLESVARPAWQEILESITKGETIATVAFEGDMAAKTMGSEVLLSGQCRNVPGGGVAQVILVVATLDESPALALIQSDAQGLSFEKSPTGLYTLTLAGAAVPETFVTPVKGDALPATLTTMKHRIQISEATGHAAAAFAMAKTFANTPPESGGKPPAARQEIGFALATMYTLLQTSRLMAEDANTKEKKPEDEAMKTSCARVFCTDAAQEICTSAVNIMGEAAFGENGPMQRMEKVQALRVEGTPIGQTREAIGNMLLKW